MLMIAPAAAGLALLLFIATISPALGQESNDSVKTFESLSFGIKTEYPANWVVDTSATGGSELMGVYTEVVSFCPEEQALPEIGSKFSCVDSDDIIAVFQFKDLNLSPAFSALENPKNITLDDVFAHTLQIFRNMGYEDRNRDFRIINKTDTAVNITTIAPAASDIINQTQELPARLYEFTYRPAFGDTEVRSHELVVLNGMTAYSVNYQYVDVLNLVERLNATSFMPEHAKIVFDSFELVTSTTPVDAAKSPPSSPASTSPTDVNVSITPGSSSKTTNSYDPNPVEVNVGDKVIWTNDDSTPHTATSGQPGEADGMFGGEAGSFGTIIPPNAKQEFTFTEAGEFPYYCGLHPNMVGTVVVTGTSSGQLQPGQQVPPSDGSSGGILGNLTEGIPDLFADG